MGVITDKLGADLKQQKDLHTFLENNKDKLLDMNLPKYLDELLAQKNLTKSDVLKKSDLPVTYAYKIFSGQKHTARNRILALAIAMQLSIDETNILSTDAKASPLLE